MSNHPQNSASFALTKDTLVSGGLVVGLLGVVFASGVLYQRVNTIDERMTQVEKNQTLNLADRDRMTRLEAQLISLNDKFDLIFSGIEVKLSTTKKPAATASN